MQHKNFKLTPFKNPALDYIVFSIFMGDTLQIDSVKISMGDYLQEIGSFKTILHREFWTHFKTPVTHTSQSVNRLISRPFRKGKEHRAHSSTVLVTFWTPFKTLHRKQRGHRTQDNQTDHSSSSSSSLHHRGNVIVPNTHLSDF